jgi:hypothetical protein
MKSIKVAIFQGPENADQYIFHKKGQFREAHPSQVMGSIIFCWDYIIGFLIWSGRSQCL